MDKTQKLQYRVTSETLIHPDIGTYRAYGLAADGKSGGGLRDVTTIRSRAEWLAERFTQLQISPVHLLDVLEDML